MMKSQNKKQSGIKKYIRKNIYLMMFVSLLISLILFNYAYRQDSNARFQSRLISLANTAAVSVNAEQHNTLLTQKDQNTAIYRQIRFSLQNIKKANPDVLYVYTLRKTNDKNGWEFVVDADEEPYPIGQAFDIAGQEAINKASLQPVADTEISTGRHGKFYTGFAPIKDSAGRTVGIAGVDISASDLIEQQENTGLFVNIGLILFILIFAVNRAGKIAGYFDQPIGKLTQGIGFLREGDYSHRIQLDTHDEFEQIGEAINDLAGKVQDNRQTVEVDLKSATEWKDKIFKVYGDVMSSMTKGKFNLINEQEALNVSRAGLLYSELALERPEDIDKAGQVVDKLLTEKDYKADLIRQYVICVTEAAANVVKHAGQGIMQIRMMDDRLRVIFTDKGRGMDLEMLPNILTLQEDAEAAPVDTGLAFIYKFAGKLFLSTSEKGTLLALDLEQK